MKYWILFYAKAAALFLARLFTSGRMKYKFMHIRVAHSLLIRNVFAQVTWQYFPLQKDEEYASGGDAFHFSTLWAWNFQKEKWKQSFKLTEKNGEKINCQQSKWNERKKLFSLVDIAKWFSIASSSFFKARWENLLAKEKLFLSFVVLLPKLRCLLAIVEVFFFNLELHEADNGVRGEEKPLFWKLNYFESF